MSLKVRFPVETLESRVLVEASITKSTSVLTLLQVCQSHWKGLALGSFSTSSMTSILILFTTLDSPSGEIEGEGN